jgi:hypothetical protein
LTPKAISEDKAVNNKYIQGHSRKWQTKPAVPDSDKRESSLTRGKPEYLRLANRCFQSKATWHDNTVGQAAANRSINIETKHQDKDRFFHLVHAIAIRKQHAKNVPDLSANWNQRQKPAT